MRRLVRREWQFLALVVLILLISLPILTYPLGRDQGEFATIGRGLLNGRVPYIDLWNPKPPAVFYVYAAAMAVFGQTAPALRAIDLIIAPLYTTEERLKVVDMTPYAMGGFCYLLKKDNTTIDSLALKVGGRFGYWFDFGDDWWHQINVEAIDEGIPRGRFPRVTKRVGKNPPQYPDE